MKTYKKGISLIVLVITVIVLAILATTVIISLSNTNIITEAKDAVQKNNLKAYEEQANLAYASWKMDNKSATLTNISDLEAYGFKASELPSGYIAYVSNGVPKITTGSVWDGSYPTDTTTFILEGEGTEASPYLINSASDFAFLGAYVNAGNGMAGKHIKLTTDIDLAGENWLPIGTVQSAFYGKFDGNNKTIFNININTAELDSSLYNDEMMAAAGVGLFGLLGDGSYDGGIIISNLTLSNGTVNGEFGYTGAFWGHAMYECHFYNLKNDNVSVIGSAVAGIGGRASAGCTVENCENTGNVSAIGNYGSAYGIVVNLDIESNANNCINRGNVTGTTWAYGIAGVGSFSSVSNCINYGNVHSGEYADPICTSLEDVNGSVSNCSNYGKVTVDEGGTITNNANVNM